MRDKFPCAKWPQHKYNWTQCKNNHQTLAKISQQLYNCVVSGVPLNYKSEC